MKRKLSSLCLIAVCVAATLWAGAAQRAQEGSDDRGADVRRTRPEQKVALVIGNAAYDARIGELTNPVNDAADVAAALRRLGFTLVGGEAHLNSGKRQMLELIREFGGRIKRGGVGVFYFAGHGVQVERRNYLIPITGALRHQEDAEFEAVDVDQIVREMEYAENALNILILDACRNNNLPRKTRDARHGLGEPARRPSGVYIAFAARDGQTAAENPGGRNGLYTQELLKNLETPNLRLEDIFINTRRGVKRLSGRRQEPVEYGSIDDVFYFKVSNGVAARPPAGAPAAPGQQADVRHSTSASGLNADAASSWRETTFNYETNEQFTIGEGEHRFVTSWSGCSARCIYSTSDYIAGIANSKLTTAAGLSDVTAYDMSSRVREAGRDEILVLKNKAGYYALVQVMNITYDRDRPANNLLAIRYKIIPRKLSPSWKYSPEKYISRGRAGRVEFDYSNNDGKFTVGEGDFKFVTYWGGSGRRAVRSYNDYVKAMFLVPEGASIKDSSDARGLRKSGRTVDLSAGGRVVLENSDGKYVVIKIVSANTEGYSSGADEVVFEYEILRD